jgi:lipid A 3-O-deacylase
VNGRVWRRWGGALLLLVAGTGGAAAEERFRFGTKDLTLAGAYSRSHESQAGTEEVDGFQLLPHFGFFLSDEQGPGWVRGNFELLAEPTVLHVEARSQSGTAAGLSALGRWVFATGGVVRPFLEAGLGVLFGQLDLRQTNCEVNFAIQGGPGLLVFLSERTALTVSYRFQHISNADSCEKNLGLNSSVFILGISYYFP